MTTNTLPPDSTKSEKTKKLIDREPGFLEKLSLLSLIIPFVSGFIYLFYPSFPTEGFFFFFSLPLFIFLPIASIFALIVQFYRDYKEYPLTSIRELILTLSGFALIINCLFWVIGLMLNER